MLGNWYAFCFERNLYIKIRIASMILSIKIHSIFIYIFVCKLRYSRLKHKEYMSKYDFTNIEKNRYDRISIRR